MLRSLFVFLRRLFGSGFLANLLAGAGLGLVSFGGLSLALNGALSLVVSYFAGVPGQVAGIVLLLGFGDALSIIGSALLVRAAIASAGVSIGRRPPSGGV